MSKGKIRVNELFRALRKAKKFQQDEFQEIVSRSYISRFETGDAELSTSKYFACLEKMGVTAEDVVSATAKLNNPDTYTYLPEYDWASLRNKRRNAIGYVTFPKGASKFAYVLDVKDDSMISSNSAFPIGCKIVVEPVTSAKDGELVIIGKRYQYFFRRWAAGYALADNESYEPIDEAIVVGKVIGVMWQADFDKK
ncbi:helix-turn-helix domain-containing protein [Vibrio aestuarianus]|uniref:helix-turn-helix domain-containing protein n=1 Tax=Vibrio aestuarianus TaxID=28171 RepID=UPI00159347FA|nr:XRE family transcriptional regulator [Vibrio aestuarianus]NGZ17990.1 helix-turn-helix domain-containing protein [Vibrio aestuarianus]